MYVEGGWKPSWEHSPPRFRLTKRQELIVAWLVVINALLLLVAPIGGATIIHAVVAVLAGG